MNSITEGRVRVVIIGAGFAGLAAARRLEEAGTVSVLLLEGSGRVGGRARSVAPFPGRPVADLGCTWVYQARDGGPGNFIFQYAQENGHFMPSGSYPDTLDILDEENTASCVHKPTLHALSTGEELHSAEILACSRLYYMAREELAQCSASGDWSSPNSRDPSWQQLQGIDPTELAGSDFRQHITRRFTEAVRLLHPLKNLEPQTKALKPAHVLQHLLVSEGSIDGTDESTDVDCATYGEFEDALSSVPLVGGFQAIAKGIASQLPSGCIHFNKEVTSIEWTQPAGSASPVLVRCSDGSTYEADHVIVTTSLGVLKYKCGQEAPEPLFSPPLPQEKLAAIQKLGMGRVNKLLLEFPHPLAGGKAGGINLYWRDEELGFPEKYPWASRINSLLRFDHTRNFYEVWFAGDNAETIESLQDEEIAEGIALVLEKFLKEPVKRPKVLQSTWCGDRLFRGSYSYNAVGSSSRDRAELSQPVSGGDSELQLLFAGEATHQSLYATTNGAYSSGVREAERLLEHYRTI